jgi:hypothetical protein
LLCEARGWGTSRIHLKEISDITMEKKTSTAKSELNSAIKEARESGKKEARIELGKWLEANVLNGPYRTVYSDIFTSMIKRLKEGKSL